MAFLILLWLTCGAWAAYQAHAGLKYDCEQEIGPGEYPLGSMWVVWRPFLAGLVLLGVSSAVAIYIIKRDRLLPSRSEGLEDDEEDDPHQQ